MRYRKLDANGDYTFGTGADFHVDSPDGVAQAIRTRLNLWKKESFHDQEDGTDWLGEVLDKRTRSPDVAIKQRILGTPGVSELQTFASTYDGDTRRLVVSARVQTIYGVTVDINETL